MEFNLTTFLFETLNFLVLTVLLWRIVYRPLRRAIRARREAVEEDVASARSAREEAEQEKQKWARREEELEALRETVRRETLDAAEKERARLLERAHEDASAELGRVRQLLESERETAERRVRTVVIERGTELAGRMLMELAPEAVEHALAVRLEDALEGHAAELKESVGAERAPEVELTGARMPSTATVEHLRGTLRRVLGRGARLTTSEDPDLLGGLSIRLGDRLFDASVAGQLEALREMAGRLERGEDPRRAPGSEGSREAG